MRSFAVKIESPILRRLGPVPFWRGGKKCLDELQRIYTRAAAAASAALGAEVERKSASAVKKMAIAAVLGMVPVLTFAERVYRQPRYTRGDTGYLVQQPLDSAAWIVHPEHAGGLDVADGLFLRFRRRFDSSGTKLEFDVSADERYVLFLDGKLVARGPARGTSDNWLYDSHRVDVALGSHVLEAVVWAGGEKSPRAQLSHRGGSFVFKAYGEHDANLTTGVADWEVGVVPGQRFTDTGKSGSFGMGCQFAAEGAGVEDALPTVWTVAVSPQPEIGRAHV